VTLAGINATSLTENIMSKQNEDQDLTKSLGDLFQEELGKSTDAKVLDCPHCGEGISKADVIAKAKGGLPGKAKKEMESEKQNSASGKGANARYGNAPKPHVATKKAGKKVAKTSPAYPGAMAAKKSDAEDDVSTEDDTSEETTETTEENVQKSARPTIYGTEHVQYYTDPSATGDAAIAKMIAEGGLGQQPTQPIDKNHKRTW